MIDILLFLTFSALLALLLVADRPDPEIEDEPDSDLQHELTGSGNLEKLTRAFNAMSQSLEESEIRLSSVVDTAVDSIITIDENGIVRAVNVATERMFGYTIPELIGRNVEMLMDAPHREAHDGYMEAYLTTGVKKIIGIGRQVEGRRKDGSKFPVDLAVSEVNLGDSRLFTGVLRDISDRVRAEEAVRQAEGAHEALLQNLETEIAKPLHDLISASEEASEPIMDPDVKDELDAMAARLKEIAGL